MARLGRNIPGVFITSGNPDSVNDAVPGVTTVGASYDLRGQIGALYRSADGQREWIYAKISATGTGTAIATNQLMLWWSSTATSTNESVPLQWVVDNNSTCSNCANPGMVAGVVRNAATRGNCVWLLRKHPSVPVTATSTGIAPGYIVYSSTLSPATSSVFVTTSTTINDAGAGAAVQYSGPTARMVGIVNSTATAAPSSWVGSTATGATGTNLDVQLFIE